jgi:hypothetical protein
MQETTIVPARVRRLLAIAFIALFAAVQALLWFAYYGHGAKPLIGDEANYQASALAILGGGAWMPSSIWPPLQSLLLALIYAIFGTHLLAAQIVQTLLFVGCAALLRDLWRCVGGTVAAANTAAALFLLNPASAAYAQWLWPEIPHLFLMLAAFWLLARPLSRPGSFVAGVCVGLALLAKSVLAPFWPAFLIVFVRRERPRVASAAAALFLVGLAIATAPALVHGWRSYGTPMIADSSVYNLWVGLNDRWRSDYVADMGGVTLPAFLASGATPQQRNAIYLGKVRTLIAERGIADVLIDQLSRQYFRLFSAKTPLVSQLPGPACAGHLSMYTSPPWLTRVLTVLNDLFHALMLMTAALGVACWPWRNPMRAGDTFPAQTVSPSTALGAGLKGSTSERLIVLFFAYQLALFLLIHVKARFLLPMIPFLCGFGGSFLVALRDRLAWAGAAAAAMPLCESGVTKSTAAAAAPMQQDPAWSRLQLTPLRLGVGALLAALLLFLAVAGPALDHLCAR